MKVLVISKQAFICIVLINIVFSLFPKIGLVKVVEPNIVMFGDDHSDGDDSAKQRKDFLNKIAKSKKDIVVFVEDIGVQNEKDLLSGLCKSIRKIKKSCIKVINVETRFFLRTAIKFFDPFLQPPFQGFSPAIVKKNSKKNYYSINFADLFKEINHLENYKERLENESEIRVGREHIKELYRSKNVLREILEKNYIFLEDSLLETAMFSYLHTLKLVSKAEEQKKAIEEIKCLYELFLKKYPCSLSEKKWGVQYRKIDKLIELFIEKYFPNGDVEMKLNPLRNDIMRELVKIDELVFDIAVLYQLLSYCEEDVQIIVLMGKDHIKSLKKLFRSVGFRVEACTNIKKPFDCLDKVI